MASFRLASGGALLDRGRAIVFTWQGRRLVGFKGDTLASALMANGATLLGRSFKYHRPRGLLGAGLDEPNILVQLGKGARTVPNLKATSIELFEGLSAEPVNCWPSPQFDLLAINRLLKPFLPAAFYYKTFKWPDWHVFEPLIRHAAGLGMAPTEADPDHYEYDYESTEVLVIGGGLSGLREALAAAESGKTVVLAEQEGFWGGRSVGLSQASDREIAAFVGKLEAHPNVRMLAYTTVFGAYDHSSYALCQRTGDGETKPDEMPRERFIKLRCSSAIMASGAIERPLLFANNDLPGVMLASAAQAYLLRQSIIPGQAIGIATNNDAGWQTALEFARRGLKPAFLADSRAAPDDTALEELEPLGVPIHRISTFRRAFGSKGIDGFELVSEGRIQRLHCDALLVSGGFNPVVNLHSQAGGKLDWDEARACFVPSGRGLPVRAVGRAAGNGLPACPPIVVPDPHETSDAGKIWVDFQNDVTVADIALAARESFSAVEHLKRYTTLGMATDQGKTSNVNGLAVMGQLTGRKPAEVGTTKFRPPYEPVTVGAVAGTHRAEQLDPLQRLPAHDIHIAAGAAMEEYGTHLRPAAYPRGGESLEEAIAREVHAVREGVGMFDASPLGKLEVHGPDAARFADLCMVGTMSTLKPGRCRYALTCRDTGIVIDDGIVVRRENGSFVIGTSSAGVSEVVAQMDEHLQCHWRDLRVALVDATKNWGVLTVAGPKARALLEACDFDMAFDPESLPHLGFREGAFGASELRVSRVSYSGEQSFELAVRADVTPELAQELLRVGEAFGLTPFGIEALDVLRVEKGFIHIGNETDGATMPQDLGLGGPLVKKKSDFIGRKGALMAVGSDPHRKQLVGLATGSATPLPIGAHVKPASGTGSDGWVTSSVFSPTLGRPHALALIADGAARLGEEIELFDVGPDNKGRSYFATIVEPCAFDPEGARMRDAA